MTFSNFKPSSKSLQGKLQTDRKKENVYCDFIIRCEDDKFDVHKCVVGSFSDFFKTMFASEMKEKHENEAKISEVSAETMRIVIEFFYDDDVKLNRDNVYNLLSAADFLQISALKIACRDFLVNNFRVDSAVEDWLTLKNCNVDANCFETKICEKRFSVIKENSLLELDVDNFSYLLKLMKVHNSIKYKCIMAWIEQNSTVRKNYFDMLMENVNFMGFPKKFLLEKISKNETIRKSPITMAMVLDAICQISSDGLSGDCSISSKMVIISETFKLKVYNANAEEWKELETSLCEHKNAGLVVKNDKLYVLGGFENGSKSSNKAMYCDLNNASSGFKEVTSMHTARRSFGCAAFNDSIYVAGGLVHQTLWSSEVESFDVDRGTWIRKAGMISKREKHALVAHRGLLYALGGNPNQSTILQSVEYYDGVRWNHAPPMKKPRHDFSAVVLNDQIYAIGGDQDDLTSVELYDPRANAWHDVASMSKQRSGHVYACVANGKIYATDEKEQSVEVYDPVVDEWSELVKDTKLQANESRAVVPNLFLVAYPF